MQIYKIIVNMEQYRTFFTEKNAGIFLRIILYVKRD